MFPIAEYGSLLCWLSAPLLVYRAVVNRKLFTLSEWLPAIAFIAVSFLVAYHSGSHKMPAYSMWIVAASYVDKKRILKVSFWIMLSCVVLTVGGSLLGILPSIVKESLTRTRMELGYNFTSFCSHHVLFLSILFVAVRGKVRYPELALLLLANYAVFKATDTRVDFVLAVSILPVLYLLLHIKLEPLMDGFPVLFFVMPFLLAVISFSAHYFYNEENELFAAANQLLNKRLMFGNRAMNYYPYMLFGQKTYHNLNGEYFFIDNYYVRTIFKTGLIFPLFIWGGFSKAIYRFCKQHERALLLALFAMLLHGLIDPELGDIRWNPFIFYVSSLFENEQRMKL
ncbi:MAG: hypothetical protein IJJ25_05635 [Lachnospiraceae bacterium]|nr:hypothetical protein [Lachnospiraceae bacterium]